MSDDLKMKAVLKLQELRKLVDVRIALLNSHRDSISNVWLDQDLTIEKATANVVDLLDSVVGNLQSGYQVQSQEIQENDEEIKALGEELFGLYNALL